MDDRPLSALLLAPQQVEALRQLATLGGNDAARSLGRLLGTTVEAAQPRAHVATKGGISKVLQPDGNAFAVHFTVEGGARLRWLLYVTKEGATLMGGLLLGRPVTEPVEKASVIYTSALAEAANIIVSSYVGGVGAGAGMTLVPSVPSRTRSRRPSGTSTRRCSSPPICACPASASRAGSSPRPRRSPCGGSWQGSASASPW